MADEQTTEEEQAAQLFEITNKLKEASPAFFASATESEIQQLIRAVKTGKERKWKHAEPPRQGSNGFTPENYTGLSDLHPLPGIEYTFAGSTNGETAPYAVYGDGLYPQSTLKIPGSEKTLEMSSDEFYKLSDAIDTFESNQNQETREKSERVRLVLEALQLWGQSLSASKSGDVLTKTGEPRMAYEDALFSVVKYGLWTT